MKTVLRTLGSVDYSSVEPYYLSEVVMVYSNHSDSLNSNLLSPLSPEHDTLNSIYSLSTEPDYMSGHVHPSNEMIVFNDYYLPYISIPLSPSNSLCLQIPLPVSSPITSVVSIANIHPMLTRSKNGLYNPKLLVATLSPHGNLFEPRNYKDGLKYPK